MNDAHSDAAGFSLIEMLISLALVVVATTAMASYLIQSAKSNKSAQMKLSTQANVRNCMSMIQSALRSAGWDPGDHNITAVALDPDPSVGDNYIEMFADLNGDGFTDGNNEDITIQHHGSTSTIEWRTTAGGPSEILAEGITNDANQDGTIEQMFTPDPLNPNLIKIQITGRSPAPDPLTGQYKVYTMTSEIVLRGRL